MYFQPYVDASGLHLPTFQDIQNYLIEQAKSIFGQDIYLENDSQDMQYIATVSKCIYDAFLCCQLAYNSQSPQTAIGAGLDSLVKLNGIQRNAATYSKVEVTCVGEPGTKIAAGVVQDTQLYRWDLPENQTLPSSGVLTCIATCEVPGNITVAPGEIQSILTPQYGWYTVSNSGAATPGVPTETDTELRARQNLSVALPSQTPLNATEAAILAVDGVTRSRVYENYTNTTDPNGIPSHSIAPVVEGGEDTDIAQAIATEKTVGCGTYGTTQITLPSQFSVGGSTNFSRPNDVIINVEITIVQLTSNYTDALQEQIVESIKNYLDTLEIGASVESSSLYYPALSAMDNQKKPSFRISSITVDGGSGAAETVSLAWNAVAKSGTVTVTGGLS